MQDFVFNARGTTFVVAHLHVPNRWKLPWLHEQCDAYVAILDADALTDDLADAIATGLASLSTDWVETMGIGAERLHDLIDTASVAIGRQAKVGDGSPMTAWMDDLLDNEAMVEWIRVGGHGALDFKIVVVISNDNDAMSFARALERVCRAEDGQRRGDVNEV